MAGDVIIISMEATSGNLDCYLILEDERSYNIAMDDDSGGGYNARIETTLPSPGFYTIMASRYGWESGTTVGDYQSSLALARAGVWPDAIPRQLYIALTWDDPVDLDLAVTDPSGNTISWVDPISPSGGALDTVNGNDFCRNLAPLPAETIYWPGGYAPIGTYTIRVTYALSCNTSTDPATFDLSIWD